MLKYAMEVPGVLHVISNLPKDLQTRLAHWGAHLSKLKLFEHMLNENYHRERLRATVLKDSKLESDMFKHFSGTLYETRWLSVYHFVCKAHPLIKVLKHKWNHRVYIEGFSKDKCDATKDSRFNPYAIRPILDDSMFHAYNKFLMAIGALLKRLASWSEACPCHAEFVRTPSGWQRRKIKWAKVFPTMRRPRCKVAGCRAPELAAGALEEILQSLAEMSLADLTRQFPQELSVADRALVLQDFDAAKSYLELGVRVKLSCWYQLPWVAAGLGHHSSDTRVSTAKTCCRNTTAALQRVTMTAITIRLQ